MKNLSEAVSSASAKLSVMLGILTTLVEEDWILYSCESAKIVYSDFRLHTNRAYSILQKEIIRIESFPKSKVIRINAGTAFRELLTAQALWKLLLGSNFVAEKDHTKYFHSGFAIVSERLPEIIKHLAEGFCD